MGFCKFSIFSFCFLFITVFGEFNEMMERAALRSFMAEIVSDPHNTLKNWSSSDLSVCSWTGIKCSNLTNRVTEIDLSEKSLAGTISPSLSNLSSLVILDLSRNFFKGRIPMDLGSLVHLQQLSLSWNHLVGNIPGELGRLHELVYLDLGSNRLSGKIPKPVFCNASSSLKYVDLSNNSLSGIIPIKNGCELKDLKFLLLWSNGLVGPVPGALSNSTKLKWLDLESNKLSGELPWRIVHKMPFLQFLYLSDNDFVSHDDNSNLEPFFASLVNSSDLQELELAGNNLAGEIPPTIGALSVNLVQIHLDDNLISGSIPPRISNLVNLTLLNLSSNFLNGSIPLELCQLRKLERIYLSNNSLSGEIPAALGELPHLGLLDLSKNKLSGSIPDSFSNLSQLRKLLLYQNQLTGKIPPSLGKCINLEILDLSRNQISGFIPNEVAGLRSLKIYLNVSSNQLYGPVPLELSKMDMVLAIDLSSNNLSGNIPPQLGSCIALESLNLSANFLNGSLPFSIGQLPYLQALDVSSNQLVGRIPESLPASPTLKKLNFSFNKFSGKVSSEGVFSWLTMDSFLGNKELCGSIRGMRKCREKYRPTFLLPIFLISSSAIFILCSVGLLLVFRSKLRNNGGNIEDDEEEDTKELKYPRISYSQLIEATGGFSSASIIGSGRFGKVYKGILRDNMRIAVKVLNTKTAGEITGSFKRECSVLKRIRHRNLMRIITICSRPDFKALVLPLMANGSLENHLYPSHGVSHGLDLVQLVSICRDVAEGVAYLHHHSPVRVVHCDLKPSNILLDDDMTALVTDFGIARLVNGGDDNASCNESDSASFSSTHGLLCGSLGYIPPEYGLGKSASTQGDVFSYGVLLLEIVTRRRPTDLIMYEEGWSLHQWVKSKYNQGSWFEQIVDEALENYGFSYDDEIVLSNAQTKRVWREVLMELIELGLMCTQLNPSARPSMVDVAMEMSLLKDYLLNPNLLSPSVSKHDQDDLC